MAERAVKQVDILMGVYEGAQHLPAQLDSLAGQSHAAWRLWVSDDSPGPESARQIEAFAQRCPQPVEMRAGPQQGHAANYLQMIRAYQAKAGYLAFADQDDVWLAPKLQRALAELPKTDRPALYCARSLYWDGGDGKRPSPKRQRPADFRNALIENVAQGNTIVLNPAAARLARQAAQQVTRVFVHDWWLYLLISGAGGEVIFDNGPPVILYRQHEANQIGSGQGARAQIRRKRAVVAGAFRERLTLNISALRECRAFLTPENIEILDRFAHAREHALPNRLRDLSTLGLYRQNRLGSLGFWGAAVLGRV